MHKSTYCVLPYNHLSIDPVGQIRPCCNYNFHHEKWPGWKWKNVKDAETVDELLGGQAHTELRKDIENNVRHDFCNRCWVLEDGGGDSYRNSWNNYFLETSDGPFKQDLSIEYLEMTLGNKCNIQCRMCNPWSSNLWAKDIVNHPELNYWNTRVDDVDFEWYNSPEFERLLEKIIPTVKHLNMLGGEPLFNEKYYEILQRIVDSGRAHEVSLQFNTNLLALQDKNFDLWREFKHVAANISCDGVEGVNEYVRYPGKWSKFLRNLDKITEWQKEIGQDRLILQIHSTLSSLTWLNLGELFKWTQTLPFEWFKLPFMIQVNQPLYMDAIHLPEEIKQLGYERLTEGMIGPGVEKWQKDNIVSLVDHVMNTERDPAMWDKFIEETNKLDLVRNQSIFTYIPEFRDHWK